ncbi:MAG: hypothetical protein M5U01_43420 [Ardenticatenaceae bacterium]|nr:hypothetical protein [Ardenticatenaceae bacterium]HBY96242.1 hypothetical protein [Chloroflexota bacterium]
MAVRTIAIEAELKRCLNSPYLKLDPTRKTQARGELDAARDLFRKAEQSFQADDEATGLKQAWGAMFRAARGLVYAAGYEVDLLRCMEIALEAHYLGKGLEMEDIAELRRAQELVGPPDAALARARAFMDKAARLL